MNDSMGEGQHAHFHEHDGGARHSHVHIDGDTVTAHAHSTLKVTVGAQPVPAVFGQPYRAVLLRELEYGVDGRAFLMRKVARIIAVRIDRPFLVETDRGPQAGKPGDWIVTNHPDDDSGSDVWSISDERMRATYEAVPLGETAWDRVIAELKGLVNRADELNGADRSPAARWRNLAISKLEDAVLRLEHAEEATR